jgi:ABC-type lipoprotein release transport system permease subunit
VNVGSTWRLAWRNLGRNRKRTFLALAAIALGQFTLVFVNCMMAGWFEQVLETVTGPLVGHVQVHHAEWREERATDLTVGGFARARRELEALPEVSSVFGRAYAAVLVAPGEREAAPADAEPAMVVGVDVTAESGRGGVLESLSAEELPGEGRVVLGRVLANRLNLSAGRQIAVIGQDADGFPTSALYRVSAVVRANTEVVNRMGVVMGFNDASELLGLEDAVHEVVIQGRDHRLAEALAERVEKLPSLAGTEVLTWREAIPEIGTMLDMKTIFDVIFLAILFAAAAAGIANTMMMSTFERTHELGMLLAVGCRPGRVVRMILLESLILGLIGVLVGSVLGTIAVLITAETGIDYAALGGIGGGESLDFAYKGINFSYTIYPKFELRQVLYGLAAVTGTSVLASLWPAALAARLEPVEAMRS